MRWNPFRITNPWIKVAYVLVTWAGVPLAVRVVMDPLQVPEVVIFTALTLLSYGVVVLGARAFRARGESILPRRVWWRATGRPAAGFVIVSVFGLASLLLLVPSPERDLGEIVGWATNLPIVAFYLISSIRLVRGDAPIPHVPRPQVDDTKLIRPNRRLLR